jgi:hypothetical protein
MRSCASTSGASTRFWPNGSVSNPSGPSRQSRQPYIVFNADQVQWEGITDGHARVVDANVKGQADRDGGRGGDGRALLRLWWHRGGSFAEPATAGEEPRAAQFPAAVGDVIAVGQPVAVGGAYNASGADDHGRAGTGSAGPGGDDAGPAAATAAAGQRRGGHAGSAPGSVL